jgi:H+/Na+-translocating ferredoxin:NAD+ oxidoreductase subunit D
MYRVQLALLPGLLATAYYFGPGIILNVLLAMLFALLLELVALKFRGASLSIARDGSALLTGALIGLALPPCLPFWMILLACIFAIIIAKHFYGGLGQNLFNPAMVGYAVLIISFPLAMSDWPVPSLSASASMVDGLSGATPLDEFRFRGALTVEEFWQTRSADNWNAWFAINAGFLAGGLYLLYSRVCNWVAPVAMLVTLAFLTLFFFDGGSSDSLGSPLFHLFSGATMMGAFFIVTDPVTSPDSRRGQALFGAGVGLLTFIIRSKGAYPEGMAFAILLMNGTSPLIDYFEYRMKPQTGSNL